jgi:hypothetical protein
VGIDDPALEQASVLEVGEALRERPRWDLEQRLPELVEAHRPLV